ncbi:MAG: ABC transporter substrate-binding protein [Lachnospiraceae bacterium]|nr:ABC transporter substrate-binding protein [Lachnospiraceae bacterium]
MKKTIIIGLIVVTMVLGLVACSGAAAAETEETKTSDFLQEPVTITDFEGDEVVVMTNPRTVAIYDYGVLDILLHIGIEHTSIERIIVPSQANLPDALFWFAKSDLVDSGGTLFYVDRDVLDLLQPELVIMGARSFGMNAAGDRLSPEDRDEFMDETQKRYDNTAWIRLGSGREINIVEDMAISVAALSAIFPGVADKIQAEYDAILEVFEEVNALASESDSTALFAMMVDATSLSVFLPGSRFNLLYDEFGFTPAATEEPEFEDQHGFDVRAEYVLSVDPDIIFLLDRSAATGAGAAYENMIRDPIIAQTSAAQKDQIFVLDADAWYIITGGFTAFRMMVEDLLQYLER